MLLSILHVGLFPNSHAFWITGMLVADRSIPLKATPLSYSLLCRLVRKKCGSRMPKIPSSFVTAVVTIIHHHYNHRGYGVSALPW